ncbi:MAG: glycosyltransferase [Pseudodesulfovibrio sp.]|uniref:Glycosyl transferase family 2 n=1 Tax=Pseudodesulfovibrio aespoeensis (strain ATCC 700646 / DSM 10631 / Aspo-2) TaxID=643562 RepID=E6VX24_PSEA9|nr:MULTISPECIES: glycosyltransferase [Pseudodesulfovibrio]MBU4380578.1 glycosyltransferase [Pseudomonadota bacterium]ADU61430.1 glycosyl transferase family 2 [Pseudodesulfovibrio aespoeensis Aspo-2]MBU4474823.1 glycosyltransferase [Pseudomonadota bacterium]MBU4516307.1 glycosyltransferase [Pseudomonadota bacterium]MBU4522488.1 glycosyltransferase [Pseudomonadota bacterium]
MSCLTSLPYGQIFDYWWQALKGEPNRIRFLLTKAIEVSAFRNSISQNKKLARKEGKVNFPLKLVPNEIYQRSAPAVVVPAYLKTAADLEMLNDLVSRLKNQTLGGQIIIVDDASPIPCPLYPDIELLLLNSNSGPAVARNKGMEKALALGADFIAFTDSDCLPSKDWLKALHDGYIDSPYVHLLSGITLSHDRCWLGKYHERNGTLNGRRLTETDRLLYGPTCNLAISAHVAKIMRFDEQFPLAAAEDIELCYRANKKGWAIEHCPNAVVHHNFGYESLPRHQALMKFWKQFRRYAEGEKLLLTRHSEYYDAFINSEEVVASEIAGTKV